MRKLLLSCQFLLLTIVCACNSSEEDKELEKEMAHVDSLTKKNLNAIDTLSRYSYLLNQFHNGHPESNATGFFIRRNNRLFLVSNYHVFTNQNTAEKKPFSTQYDSLTLVYKRKPDIKAFYTIDLRKIREASNSCFYFEYPDAYIYELTKMLHPEAIIYSIEDLIKPIPKTKILPIDIFSCGYANGELKTFHFTNSSKGVYDTTSISYEPFHLKAFVSNSYFVNSQATGGMSGSPVFYKYREGNDHSTDNIIFAGIISTQVPSLNKEVIVKPQEVIKMLNQKMKK